MMDAQPRDFSQPKKSPDLTEKEKIRRVGALVGIPMIFLTLFARYWFKILTDLLSVFGILPQQVSAFVFEKGTNEAIQVMVSILLFTLPFLFAGLLSEKRIGELVPTKAVKVQKAAPLFLFGIGFCAFANMAVSLAGRLFESFGVEYAVNFGENPSGVYGFFLTVLSTAVTPALVEEFANRGIVMGLLKPFGDGFAILVSSILFGVMHGNFEQMPFAFLVGLVLGYIRIATDSIWICILVHGFNNFISVFFDYAFPSLTASEQNALYLVLMMVFLLVGIVSVLLLGNRDTAVKKSASSDGPFWKKLGWFFSSVWIIVFLVLAVYESCLYFI